MGRNAGRKLNQRDKEIRRPQASTRRRRKWLIGILLALLIAGGGVGAWLWNGTRATPEPAPRFNLLASNGRVISLDEFRGKQEVVLFFYMSAG